MAETTKISWCDHTWSPWYGCTQVSMGPQGACEGCYARQMSEHRFHRVVFGGPGRGEGTREVRADSAWKEPLKWNREAPGSSVFPSMCDPFDNHPTLRAPRRRFFDLIRATPNLTWLLLTKRPGNIVKLFAEAYGGVLAPGYKAADYWPRNAAIGCTVVTQEEAGRDVPKLLAAKAALKPAFAFLSMEPLLGRVDLQDIHLPDGRQMQALRGSIWNGSYWTADCERVDWVIAGGETDQGKHKARPSHPDWFRSLRDQCAAAGVPFHLKQWGEYLPEGQFDAEGFQWAPGSDDPRVHWHCEVPSDEPLRDGDCSIRIGEKKAGRTLDGVIHDARPEVRA